MPRLGSRDVRFCEACESVNGTTAVRCMVCSARLHPSSPDLFDGRYQTVRELGRGASGVVWAAEDRSLRRPVALKFLAPPLARNPTAVRRFQREAAALASIRSEHVAQVHAFGVEGPSSFIVMELIQGRTLEALLEEHESNETFIPVHRGLVMLRELARGLAAVHASGLVHRDVKPANVVVEQGTGRTVLVDFGLAVHTAERRALESVGSPAYMPPEQAAGEATLTSRADVYALGCTGYHLLTNRLVFPHDDVLSMIEAQLEQAPSPPSTHRPELEPLDWVFLRALQKDPADRFASAIELANALDSAGAPWLRQAVEGTADAGPHNVRILVVDDDDAFAALAVRAAQLAFFGTSARVARARTGEEALRDAAAKPPQLVLLDFHMPGLDGVEVLSRLRALPGASEARVLVLSAKAGEHARWRFDALGVDGFVRKPIELRALVDVIGSLSRARGWIPLEEDADEGTN